MWKRMREQEGLRNYLLFSALETLSLCLLHELNPFPLLIWACVKKRWELRGVGTHGLVGRKKDQELLCFREKKEYKSDLGEGSIVSHIEEIRCFSGSSKNAPNLSERHGHLWALDVISGKSTLGYMSHKHLLCMGLELNHY